MATGDDERKARIDAAPADLPTAFVHEARLRIFQPTRRPRSEVQVVEIESGPNRRVTIEYRALQRPDGAFEVRALGQAHADVLDAIRETALDKKVDGAGRLMLLCDPAKVRKAAGVTASLTTVRERIEDIMGAVIEIREPRHLRDRGPLIGRFTDATVDGAAMTLPCNLSHTQRHASRAQRRLWLITIGDVGMRLVVNDIAARYSVVDVAALPSGISQAVARWMLGQSASRQPNGGWKLDTVIEAVGGGDAGEGAMRHRRCELRAARGDLSAMGIVIDGDQRGERIFLARAANA